MPKRLALALLVLALAHSSGWAQTARPAPARRAYENVLARERTLAARPGAPSPKAVRALVNQYESVAMRYARTGYADNALWRGGQLAAELYARTKRPSDRQAASRLLKHLTSRYPSSSLVPEARAALRTLSPRTRPPRPSNTGATTKASRAPAGSGEAAPILGAEPTVRSRELPAAALPARLTRELAPPIAASPARLVNLQRSVLPGVVRVTIELDAEVPFHEERLDDPSRVFFDLQGAAAPLPLLDRPLDFEDDVVRQIRVGRRPGETTRVAMDLEGVKRYSVFALYDPFRVVIDFERDATSEAAAATKPSPAMSSPAPLPSAPPASSGAGSKTAPGEERTADIAARPLPPARPEAVAATSPPAIVAPPVLTWPAPEAPAKNSSGSFSLSRQLGLGISRIVIDPGHGGHDPGAISKHVGEAELVLDVALRLEQLLLRQPGVEVVLTRRTDVFVPLEERTAIANRERADLFLSVHANASRNVRARGVETYFLNFATTPEAEAVAARENSASGRTMHNLPDMVRAIALNNKLDESRDLARMVQRSMVKRLRSHDEDVRDLGVKQAPFVVLIGAQMPSVLAEVSFVTHPQEGKLLKNSAYRQKVAVALFDAIADYQRSLKSIGTVAAQ